MIQWVPGVTIEGAEKQIILQAFKFYKQHKVQTAASIGLSLRTLDIKLEKYAADDRDQLARTEHANRERQIQSDRHRGIKEGAVPSANIRFAQRLRVEPHAEVTAESKVSVPERSEVQEVLPKQTTGSGKARGRS